jgi:phage shock protein PspC (stress-responsive transcriptional regulator)
VNSWFRNIIEMQVYGACSNLAEYLNMKASSVRIFFIYSSFLTFGSPLLVYLILMFVFRLKI